MSPAAAAICIRRLLGKYPVGKYCIKFNKTVKALITKLVNNLVAFFDDLKQCIYVFRS